MNPIGRPVSASHAARRSSQGRIGVSDRLAASRSQRLRSKFSRTHTSKPRAENRNATGQPT